MKNPLELETRGFKRGLARMTALALALAHLRKYELVGVPMLGHVEALDRGELTTRGSQT